MRDLRLAESTLTAYAAVQARYAEIRAGAPIFESELPVREDFAAVYNFIRRRARFGEEEFAVREMLMRDDILEEIGYIKLRIILSVLMEMNLVGMEETGEEKYSFRVHYQQKHTDLEKSAILRKLRSGMHKG